MQDCPNCKQQHYDVNNCKNLKRTKANIFPKRYCRYHGNEMEFQDRFKFYDERTGQVDNITQYYRCPMKMGWLFNWNRKCYQAWKIEINPLKNNKVIWDDGFSLEPIYYM